MKDVMLNKVTLRLIYITAAFVTAHFSAFVASPKVVALLSKIGVSFNITDPQAFETAITLVLLWVGEVIYRKTHTKLILPVVTPKPPA